MDIALPLHLADPAFHIVSGVSLEILSTSSCGQLKKNLLLTQEMLEGTVVTNMYLGTGELA